MGFGERRVQGVVAGPSGRPIPYTRRAVRLGQRSVNGVGSGSRRVERWLGGGKRRFRNAGRFGGRCSLSVNGVGSGSRRVERRLGGRKRRFRHTGRFLSMHGVDSGSRRVERCLGSGKRRFGHNRRFGGWCPLLRAPKLQRQRP
jgi:hypothetical protein